METYEELLGQGHVVEVDAHYPKKLGDADLVSRIKSNSYNTAMLIDAVAQKAFEHHFKNSAPQPVSSARENAGIGIASAATASTGRGAKPLLFALLV